MNRLSVSPHFWRDFFLGLPLLLEIIAFLSIDHTPWKQYAAYFPFIIVITLLITLVLGGIMAFLDALRRKTS